MAIRNWDDDKLIEEMSDAVMWGRSNDGFPCDADFEARMAKDLACAYYEIYRLRRGMRDPGQDWHNAMALAKDRGDD